MPETISARELLRHTVATISYRVAKVVRDAPPHYADFEAGQNCRTPRQILAHIGDLFDWALSLSKGERRWHSSEPLPWPDEVERFFGSVQRFDDFLGGSEPLQVSPDKIMQGPLSDAMNHLGQLAILRRLAGAPIRGENYYKADIAMGRVGREQSSPKLEFD
jgi:hypothetical protein